MFNDIFEILLYFYGYCIFFFSLALILTYVALVIMAYRYSRKYQRWSNDYIKRMVDSSPYVPGVTIVAGAYNEEAVIEKSVKSLLDLDYPNFEVCIVRNSPTIDSDNTLKVLIDKFDLVQIPYDYIEEIHTEPFRGLYRSTNKMYDKLIVIDKKSGGTKADAINGGLNVIKNPYIINTDVDCILSKEAIYQCIFPILQDETVIAVSGTMSINNGFDYDKSIKDKTVIAERKAPDFPLSLKNLKNWCKLLGLVAVAGFAIYAAFFYLPPQDKSPWLTYLAYSVLALCVLKLIDILLPVALIQDLEYKRSFLVGKMGWSQINAMNNVSGGYGLFNTEVVKAAGGYGKDSFAEDMDMLTRMVAYCCETGRDYRVVQIPHTCCWTQATTDLENLYKQRKRWGRGLIQVMWEHRRIIGNPKYKRMGMITFINTLFFEFLAPIIEFIGYFIMIWLFCNDKVNMTTFWWVLGSIYTFSVLLNQFVLAFDYMLGGSYDHAYRNYAKLFAVSFLEPIYHFFVVIFSLKGYFDYITGKKAKWDSIKRI